MPNWYRERVHVPVMLALVQEDVHEDVHGTVEQRLAVDVHLARRHQRTVAERIEVVAGVTANAAPIDLELDRC